MTINVHNHVDTAEILSLLNILKLQNATIMSKIDELNDQVAALKTQVADLQAAVDAEQQQIEQLLNQNAAVVTDLNNQITILNEQLAQGATPEQLSALSSSLNDIKESIATTKADIEGTVPDDSEAEG